MKILLTNDDGYEAENIKNLYEKLSQDHEVWIIAPKDNCSGMSAAISYLKEIPVDKISDRVYAVDGTPAYCSYLGLLSIVDFEFDIVISGINHGANIGNDVLYSGTVGAAVGGRNLKYPPIAISVASYDAKDIDFISLKSIEIIDIIKKLKGKHTILVVEHDMAFVRDIAERITVMHLGKLLAEGDIDTIEKDEAVREAYLGSGGIH